MRRSRPWAMVVTLLLLMGQAALASASAPCVCRAAATHDAGSCCCGHAPGEPCPCSPHDGSRSDSVQGSCAHEMLAVTAHAMVVAPPQPATPLPALLPAPLPAIDSEVRVILADWQGPPLRPQRLTALRTVVLRN